MYISCIFVVLFQAKIMFDQDLLKKVIMDFIPFCRHLGFEVIEISDGFAIIKVPFQDFFVGDPRVGRLHGGVVSTLIDTVGGVAGMTTLVSAEDQISTIDMRVDYLKPAKSEDLFGSGKIIRSGNRIVVTEMKVWQSNPDELIAVGKAVYNVKRKTDV